ncbi:uncharacterized protein C17orf98-like [Pristis pectinata]|uniref:uncharacterized protein C17orf98-like n=1 Tax=Pristis pectinata TaxID=685728 RepID=UPI00223DA1FB|nr:uncharacterized protein C17orf98-like [Pristis pectinata]
MNSSRCPPGACCLDYEYFKRERGFILDCVAVSSNSLTYEKVHPKLCDVIPPYNAQNDPYAKHIFETKSMKKLLKRTNQDQGGTSNSGWLVDYFYKNGPAQKYLTRRNVYGTGHSHDQVIGHRGYLSDVKPIVGYNGKFGYRRNIPSLREKPSIFGEHRGQQRQQGAGAACGDLQPKGAAVAAAMSCSYCDLQPKGAAAAAAAIVVTEFPCRRA